MMSSFSCSIWFCRLLKTQLQSHISDFYFICLLCSTSDAHIFISSPMKWASTHSWNKMALFNYSFELLILCINVLSINAVPKAFSSSEGPCWERKKMQLCNVKPYLCVCCRISGFSLIAESQCALMHWPFALYTRCRCAGVWGHLRTAFTTSQRYNCSSSS